MITTKDGKDIKFRIAEISSEGMIGMTELRDNQQILFTEIAKIKKTHPGPSKTIAVIVIPIVSIVLLWTIIFPEGLEK